MSSAQGRGLFAAVNAVRFTDDGRLLGDNFDGHGFVAGLLGENPADAPNGEILQDKSILILELVVRPAQLLFLYQISLSLVLTSQTGRIAERKQSTRQEIIQ